MVDAKTVIEQEKQKLIEERETLDLLNSFWEELSEGFILNEKGKNDLRLWLSLYPLKGILDAMKTAMVQKAVYENGLPTNESLEVVFKLTGRILNFKASPAGSDPELKRLLYIRGILRNRFEYCKGYEALALLRKVVDAGYDINYLEGYAKDVSSWSKWRDTMYDWIKVEEEEGRGGKPMKFNINETVLVKLTDYGREIWRTSNLSLNLPPPTPVAEDREGWSSWQMWLLMEVFGPYIHMGATSLPFEPTIRIPSSHLEEEG